VEELALLPGEYVIVVPDTEAPVTLKEEMDMDGL
jgi:hypothetical protein